MLGNEPKDSKDQKQRHPDDGHENAQESYCLPPALGAIERPPGNHP